MQSYFHIHLISDATGETLLSVSRAAAAQYANVRAIEHIYPLVRTNKQLDRVLAEVEAAPGIALYTLVDHELGQRLEDTCRTLGLPCVSILDPVLGVFRSYLGTKSTPRIGGQHVLDADYFKRIDALNFTIAHDDGQLPSDITEADVILVGISRTSKTPTSIYLANRGIKTANVPLVPDIPLPPALTQSLGALVVGLIATPERIVQIRRNRLLSMEVKGDTAYVDRDAVVAEIAYTRKLCKQHNWPVIDVTRRSIEETAAAVISLHQERKQHA